MKFHVTVEGHEFVVELSGGPGGRTEASVDGRAISLRAREPAASGQQLGLEVLVQDGARRLAVARLPGGAAGEAGALRLIVGNLPAQAHVETERDRLRAASRPGASRSGSTTATSSLPGVIRRILLKAGDPVEEGTPILTLEAMKMENDVRAETAGKVKTIFVQEGQVVNAGERLAEIEREG
jgi:biotin carboxyl carrier protein